MLFQQKRTLNTNKKEQRITMECKQNLCSCINGDERFQIAKISATSSIAQWPTTLLHPFGFVFHTSVLNKIRMIA